MKPVELDHVVIAVSDWDRARDFYVRVLGAEVAELGPAGRRAFRIGATQLNVHLPEDVEAAASDNAPANLARIPVTPGGSDLCFRWSGSVEEAVAHLESCGVEVDLGPIERPGRRGAGTSVYFRDPDGSLLEFITYS